MRNENVCPAVPPLYTWDSGTSSIERDSYRDKSGTASLKSLALAILSVPLERDKRDKERDKGKNLVPLGQGGAGQKIPLKKCLSLEKYDPEGEALTLPALTMANACIYCPEWRDRPGFPWWSGTCAATGEKRTRRSVCTVPGAEVLQ